MNKMKFVLLATAFSAFALTGCFESESEDNAAQNNAAVQEQPADEANGNPDSTITGVYCQKTEAKNTNLAVIEEENGDLSFSLSVWDNASGHDCGILNGDAVKEGEGWIFSSDVDGTPCSITITAQNGLTLSQGEEACRSFCGVNASIGEINLPEDTKARTSVTSADLSSLYEAPLCE